jgi:hypothetical protein
MDEGRELEGVKVCLVRREVLFRQEFEGVGKGLQESPLAHAHRAEARLHEGGDLALGVSRIERIEGNGCDDCADLNERPDDVVDRLRLEELQEQVVYQIWGREIRKHKNPEVRCWMSDVS